MKLYNTLRFSLVFLCCGCQSKQMISFSLPAKAASDSKGNDARGVSAFTGSIGSLRDAGSVKAYGINRYVDPADSRILHERHAIYRLEQQPAWITRSPKYQNEVILGPVVGLKQPEYAPEPLPGETSREIVNARRGVELANESIDSIRQNEEKLAGSVQSLAKETAEAERKLTSVVTVLNERIKRLEGDAGIAPDERSRGDSAGVSDSGANARPPN
jgi:hypothetical protein